MKLSNLAGPFEEATAGMAGGADRIQGTELTPRAVLLDGTLPPQAQSWWHKLTRPGVIAGALLVGVAYAAWKRQNR